MMLLVLFAALVAARADFLGKKEEEAYKGYAEIFRQGEGLMEPDEVTERRLNPLFDKCDMEGDPTKCPIGGMSLLDTTVVESGGPTRCIFDLGENGKIQYRSKYEFQVVPGGYKDKVILFLQGGGGFCYDQNSTQSLLCNSYIRYEIPQKGILDVNDPANPYANYTVVVASHCSGDFHLGDVERDYTVRKSSVVQYGQKNLASVVSWIVTQQQNQSSQSLAPELSELVIAGEAGGSVAAHILSPALVQAIPARRVRVLSDSQIGIFPKSFSEALRDLGGCDLLLTDSSKEKCRTGDLQYRSIVQDTLKALGKSVPMLFSNAKGAVTQMSLYNMLHLSYGGSEEKTITVEEWYDKANARLKKLRDFNDVAFWVQGYRHKFLATPYFERTSVFGTATPRDLDTQMLEQWIRTLDEDGIACQQCSGELRDSQDDNNTNIRYCDIYLEDQCAKFP
mmetsp:Transcript_8213/g.30853  ORF Transcript_8213/g.30853 Transcript_8213/m.30853 type:complete len:451 (-) Transcript_8213:361-1713(-)